MRVGIKKKKKTQQKKPRLSSSICEFIHWFVFTDVINWISPKVVILPNRALRTSQFFIAPLVYLMEDQAVPLLSYWTVTNQPVAGSGSEGPTNEPANLELENTDPTTQLQSSDWISRKTRMKNRQKKESRPDLWGRGPSQRGSLAQLIIPLSVEMLSNWKSNHLMPQHRSTNTVISERYFTQWYWIFFFNPLSVYGNQIWWWFFFITAHF